MRHDPIRVTHRAAHPAWCGCRTCRPPVPSVRRDSSALLLIGVPFGLAIGAAIGAIAGFDLATQLALVTGG